MGLTMNVRPSRNLRIREQHGPGLRGASRLVGADTPGVASTRPEYSDVVALLPPRGARTEHSGMVPGRRGAREVLGRVPASCVVRASKLLYQFGRCARAPAAPPARAAPSVEASPCPIFGHPTQPRPLPSQRPTQCPCKLGHGLCCVSFKKRQRCGVFTRRNSHAETARAEQNQTAAWESN